MGTTDKIFLVTMVILITLLSKGKSSDSLNCQNIRSLFIGNVKRKFVQGI